MHPSNKDSFALLITNKIVSHFSPLVSVAKQTHTSDIEEALQFCQSDSLSNCSLTTYNEAVDEFRSATPNAGTYFNEADYHEPNSLPSNKRCATSHFRKYDFLGGIKCCHCDSLSDSVSRPLIHSKLL